MERKVILLFGGESEERLVSVASAQCMAEALPTAKLWFWHKDGAVFEVPYKELIDHKDPFTVAFNPSHNSIYKNIEDAIFSSSADGHVFLLGVHGGLGENGHLQKLLETAQRPFTGSGSVASARAFNKALTKEALAPHRIKMAPHVIIDPEATSCKGQLHDFFLAHGPSVIKPVCGGSSIGCSFIRSENDIDHIAQTLVTSSSHAFLAEKLIVGREFTIGVVDGLDGPVGLPGTEIVLEHNRDFDYLGKYLGVGSKEITPPQLSPELMHEARRLAETAHLALALNGYSRTDMILASNGFHFLETNTLPGLSKQSLVPQQLAAQGTSMREFINSQIEIACHRTF